MSLVGARPSSFEIFTCDRGRRRYDAERDPPALLAAIVQEVVESGFWRELDRIPMDVIRSSLPHLTLPANTRRLLEIWTQERRRDA